MKLYDYFRSTASYRVRIALNIKQICFTKIPVNLLEKDQQKPEYTALNPQALVPTLDENGHMLTQSLAIIEYLDEINPEPPLLPPNPLGRAQVRSLALSVACDIHPINNLRVLTQLRDQFKATDEQVNQWYQHWLTLGFQAFETKLQALSRKENVCFGSEVTMADICLIPQVYNAKRYKLDLTPYPLITAINDYCLTLPAFLAAQP